MKSSYLYLLVAIASLTWRTSLLAADATLHSYLAFACDGTGREQQFLFERPATWIVNQNRAVDSKLGSIIYRVPVARTQLDRLSLELNQVPYRLEFSADGTNWESLIAIVSVASKPMEFGTQGTGFSDAQREAARASGYAWFRIRPASESQEIVQLKHFQLAVNGSEVPTYFVRAAWWRDLSRYSTGPLMMVVALVPVLFFWKRWGGGWRLWIGGAALWVISVALKMVFAALANSPVQQWLRGCFVHSWADLFFWCFIGLLTGIFECGVFLVFAPQIKRRKWTFGQALALGLGFGAVEALLLGIVTLVAAFQMNTAFHLSTWSESLVGPFERLLTLPIHTVAAVMIVRALAERNWRWFWASFAYKSAVDGVAAWLLLSGTSLLSHHWLMELICFAPFALLGIIGLVYFWKIWNESPPEHRSQPLPNPPEFHGNELPKPFSPS